MQKNTVGCPKSRNGVCQCNIANKTYMFSVIMGDISNTDWLVYSEFTVHACLRWLYVIAISKHTHIFSFCWVVFDVL